nr:trypsin family protein [Tanacetum cinerariifolium]
GCFFSNNLLFCGVADKTFKDLGEVTRGFPTTRRMLLTSLLMPIVIPLQGALIFFGGHNHYWLEGLKFAY